MRAPFFMAAGVTLIISETFFTASGFRLIDKDDLSKDEISFVTAWGACDEDIYRRAIREADTARTGERIFFSIS